MFSIAVSADAFRYLSAIVALLVLLLLTVSLARWGQELTTAWRRVIVAVTVQQAVTSYVYVVRARNTPDGLPERVDLSLAGLAISGITLLICVLGVFAGRRNRDPR